MAELVKIYTAEDFLVGTEPYEEVYALHNNPLAEQQAIERLAKNAKQVKGPNFKTMYKAYVATMKSALPASENANCTAFTGQPIELRCGYWQADDGALEEPEQLSADMRTQVPRQLDRERRREGRAEANPARRPCGPPRSALLACAAA